MPEFYRRDVAKIDLNKPLMHSHAGEVLVTGDKNGYRFGAEAYRAGESVDLSGCTVEGVFIAPNGETFIIPGMAEGNLAYVDLTAECCVMEGAFSLALKITTDTVVNTLRMIDGSIRLAHGYADAVSTMKAGVVEVVLAVEEDALYSLAYVTIGHDGASTVYNASCQGPQTLSCVPDTLLAIKLGAVSAIAASDMELLETDGQQYLFRVGDVNSVMTVDGASAKVDAVTVGELFSITETDGNAWYRLVDKDYNGQGLALLVREECAGKSRFWPSYREQEIDHYYNGSLLDTSMNQFYTSLPAATKSKIALTTIPVRKDAVGNTKQAYLERYVFPLSSTEWGFAGSAYEGEQIEDTSKLIANEAYWTREPVSGMRNFSYAVYTTGRRANHDITNDCGMRPAFCISLDKSVAMVEGGWELK